MNGRIEKYQNHLKKNHILKRMLETKPLPPPPLWSVIPQSCSALLPSSCDAPTPPSLAAVLPSLEPVPVNSSSPLMSAMAAVTDSKSLVSSLQSRLGVKTICIGSDPCNQRGRKQPPLAFSFQLARIDGATDFPPAVIWVQRRGRQIVGNRQFRAQCLLSYLETRYLYNIKQKI